MTERTDTTRLDFLADRPDILKKCTSSYDWMGRDNPQRRTELRRTIDAAMDAEGRG